MTQQFGDGSRLKQPKTWEPSEWRGGYVPWMAMEPSLVAGRDESDPRRAPMGVRATPTMQTSRALRPWLPSLVVPAELDDAMIDRWVDS